MEIMRASLLLVVVLHKHDNEKAFPYIVAHAFSRCRRLHDQGEFKARGYSSNSGGVAHSCFFHCCRRTISCG